MKSKKHAFGFPGHLFIRVFCKKTVGEFAQCIPFIDLVKEWLPKSRWQCSHARVERSSYDVMEYKTKSKDVRAFSRLSSKVLLDLPKWTFDNEAELS